MLRRLIDWMWRCIASALVSNLELTHWIVRQSFLTPYYHIMSADGQDMYMGRWWLFNPYDDSHQNKYRFFAWNIRIHHIKREDRDRDLHDHPRNSRTIILKGWYREERKDGNYLREAGYTGRIPFGVFHRIAEVSPGGVWTIFITGPYRGGWGFDVDGVKVPWKKYLGIEK